MFAPIVIVTIVIVTFYFASIYIYSKSKCFTFRISSISQNIPCYLLSLPSLQGCYQIFLAKIFILSIKVDIFLHEFNMSLVMEVVASRKIYNFFCKILKKTPMLELFLINLLALGSNSLLPSYRFIHYLVIRKHLVSFFPVFVSSDWKKIQLFLKSRSLVSTLTKMLHFLLAFRL